MEKIFDKELALNFTELALKNIRREFPHAGHSLSAPSDIKNPAAVHPAFYGCFDWHSCVHTHWMLVRILKLFPDIKVAKEIKSALDENISAERIEGEVTYFKKHPSFERTYGWAWLLKLYEELSGFEDGKQWLKNLQPLADEIVGLYLHFLPEQKYPIRCGKHQNTAFGIAFALDYAKKLRNRELEDMLTERSLSYFGKDVNCPASWEPDGDDFLSPSLMEAALMQRVLPEEEFSEWLHRFLPVISFKPVIIQDRSDPYMVHMDGLNLSRAWCMLEISKALPSSSALYKSAAEHADASLPYIMSGHYEGEHWLATFAVYLLTL